MERTGLAEEVIERLIRAGALDSLGRPRRELLWQLREVAGAAKGRVDGRTGRGARPASKRAAGRPMDLRLPATEAPALPPITEPERLGDAYAVLWLDARRQVVELFRQALDRLGAVTNAALADRGPGPVLIGGLVVTRQHPMTARGTVFLALEDETGMVNVTLWPDTWQRLRSVVRRHALLLVDGDLQREGNVVNVVARGVVPLVEATGSAGGPEAHRPGSGTWAWRGCGGWGRARGRAVARGEVTARERRPGAGWRGTGAGRRRASPRRRRPRSGPSSVARSPTPGRDAFIDSSPRRSRRIGRTRHRLLAARLRGRDAGAVTRRSGEVSGARSAARRRAGGLLAGAAAALLGARLVAVRVRQVQEPAIPGGRRGEQRGAHRGQRAIWAMTAFAG